ncbi:MAG: VOC family protein [Pseudonocardiaceae bacterium]
MSTKIFVNLPVRDLAKSIDFFTKIGFSVNPQFSDENAACVVISEDIYAMLLVEKFFQSFTSKQLVDATTSTEAILALGLDSKQQVDDLVDKALAAGGQPGQFSNDDSFMYGRSFQDLDGHLWEALYMDPTAIPEHA